MKYYFILFVSILTVFGCSSAIESDYYSTNSCIESKIFFGLSNKDGVITETQWDDFLNNEILQRYPDGFTIIDGKGFWRNCDTCQIYSENSKILIVVYPEVNFVENQILLDEIMSIYLKLFYNQALLITNTKTDCNFKLNEDL